MVIGVEYAGGAAGGALADLNQCDQAGGGDFDRLCHILFNHINERLRKKTPAKLEKHLASLRVWKDHDGIAVYKTGDLPCCAYTAFWRDGDLIILVLGFCAAYPGSADLWWTQVIEPRLIEHL